MPTLNLNSKLFPNGITCHTTNNPEFCNEDYMGYLGGEPLCIEYAIRFDVPKVE
jgi:hypothetical protein